MRIMEREVTWDDITREELKFLFHAKAMSDALIAQEFNVSPNEVKKKRYQLNLKQNQLPVENFDKFGPLCISTVEALVDFYDIQFALGEDTVLREASVEEIKRSMLLRLICVLRYATEEEIETLKKIEEAISRRMIE